MSQSGIKNLLKRRKIEIYLNMLLMMTFLILGSILRADGIAYTLTAYMFMEFVWCLIGSKTTDALSKMIRSACAKGQFDHVKATAKRVMSVQGLISLFASVVFAAAAIPISGSLVHMPNAASIMVGFAPLFFLRTLSASITGKFSGKGNEIQAVVSGIVRQILFLVLSLSVMMYFVRYGEKVSDLLQQDTFRGMYGGLGVAIAAVITELIILCILIVRNAKDKTNPGKNKEVSKYTEPVPNTLKVFYKTMWQDALIGALVILMFLDGAVCFMRNVADANVGLVQYGIFIGRLIPLLLCVSLPIMAFFLEITIRGITFLKKDDESRGKFCLKSGIHLGLIHSLFAAVFLIVMAEPLSSMISGEQQQLFVRLIRYGAFLIPVCTFLYMFCKILMFLGKKLIVIGSLVFMNLLYIIFLIVGLKGEAPDPGVLVIGAVAATSFALIIVGYLCFCMIRFRLSEFIILGIPVGAAVVSGLLQVLLYKFIGPHLGSIMTLLITMIISVTVYWILLFMSGNVSEQELRLSPLGSRIYQLGHTFHMV